MRNTGNNNRRIRERIGSMLLALFVSASMMPVFAFAEDEIPAEEFELTEETAAVDLPESDELLSGFIDAGISGETGTSYNGMQPDADSGQTAKKAKLARRSIVLNEREQIAYDQIKTYIENIAAGREPEALFYVPEDGGVNYALVVNALMTDMPYEFYWYDKTLGFLHGTTVSGRYHGFYFPVSIDYWSPSVFIEYDGKRYVYGLNTSKTGRARATVSNVSDIINEFADKPDIDKLYGYRNRICEFTSYDSSAEKRMNDYYSGVSKDPFYGDPWQLIYVFDGDDSTRVVCEGYSKAFQYLCNRTSFDAADIECYTVSGDLLRYSQGGFRSLGGHMWNVIHMDNGGNYIADVTNCDKGSFAIENFFLSGYTDGNITDGYVFDPLAYVYDNDTRNLFTAEELTLSDSAYDIGTPVITECPAMEVSCTQDGCIRHWLRLGYYYADEACTQRLTYAQTYTRRLGHDWSDWKTTKAVTCTSNGTQQHICSRCGKEETRTVTAPGHSWKTTVNSLDYKDQKCARCGKTRRVSKVIVDLPKVRISKPYKSKKAFTAKWKKVSSKNRKKISGIEIQYSTSRKFTDAKSVVKKAKKTATFKNITKLKSRKTYYVRVRSYKKINGKKHVSKWSAVKKVRTR